MIVLRIRPPRRTRSWNHRLSAEVGWFCSHNGGTIGFLMSDGKMAEAWHKAGVANGGTSIEDPPGVRPNGAYLAYLRDPDGNKIVAVAR